MGESHRGSWPPSAAGAGSQESAPTDSAVGERRTRGRVLGKLVAAAAQKARLALGDDGCTDGALGKRLGVSRQQVARWLDTDDAKGLHLGDVLVMPRELAREILVRALGALEEGSGPGPRDTLDRITIELGVAVQDLARDLADGQMDDAAKHRAHLCRIGTLALRGYLGLGGDGAL